MSFKPPFCPRYACPSLTSDAPWSYRRNGRYKRACDGRIVQRYRCDECNGGFSSQTFRTDYRHKKPWLNVAIYKLLISKVTLRQAARILDVNKKAVPLRVPLLGSIAKAVHEHLAPGRTEAAFTDAEFQLDELETFAHSRRNNPLTVPVLIHCDSFFVVHTEVAPMPRRGGLGRDEKEPEVLDEAQERERREGSKKAVGACCERLGALVPPAAKARVATDQKSTYPGLLAKALGERLVHSTTHSKEPRGTENPLFKINLTLAMMRDGLSRLVRRTWAASKLEPRLRNHLWIWTAWRNYMRGKTNACRHETPAMAIGVCEGKVAMKDFFLWRAPFVAALFRG